MSAETTTAGTRWGTASHVQRLDRVLVRRPSVEGDFVGAGWRPPDTDALSAEHDAFIAVLGELGCGVEAAAAATGMVDAVYAHDPVVMTPWGAVVLQMRKLARIDEPTRMRADLEGLGVPILGELHGPAVMDGGDKVWLDDATLLVGRGYRTNAAAVAQLRALLEPHGVEVVDVDLPHYRGPDEVLHLMSVISPLDVDLAVVYPPLAPVALMELLEHRGIATVAVPDDEFATQGGNILATSPRVAVMVSGNPGTAEAVRAAGCEVHEFSAPNLCVKGDGGPTCLTQPLLRR